MEINPAIASQAHACKQWLPYNGGTHPLNFGSKSDAKARNLRLVESGGLFGVRAGGW